MTTIAIELPDESAEEAKSSGLLAADSVEAMIARGFVGGPGKSLWRRRQDGRNGWPAHDPGRDSRGGEHGASGKAVACAWSLTPTSWCRR